MYNLYIGKNTWIHDKNKKGLNLLIKYKCLNIVNNIDDANILLFASFQNNNTIDEIDIYDIKYRNKLIILGPHFSVFPNDYIKNINYNINKNIIYNLLSDWVINEWKKTINNLPLVSLPFPVDVDLFKPDNDIIYNNKKKIMIYIKQRKEEDYLYIIKYLENLYDKNNIKIFNYDDKYNEVDFIETLKDTKFCIWIGRHESQGFALEETLALNVPILVFNVKNMGQEKGFENNYEYLQINATTIPYWNEYCGEYFTDLNEFENIFQIFIKNIINGYYKPREFIINNLSPTSIFKKYWEPIIKKYITI
jgi:hypothetical protein